MEKELIQIQSEFCKADLDDDGVIDFREFCLLLGSLGLDGSSDLLRISFDAIDQNSSGSITFGEFRVWWQKTGKRMRAEKNF